MMILKRAQNVSAAPSRIALAEQAVEAADAFLPEAALAPSTPQADVQSGEAERIFVIADDLFLPEQAPTPTWDRRPARKMKVGVDRPRAVGKLTRPRPTAPDEISTSTQSPRPERRWYSIARAGVLLAAGLVLGLGLAFFSFIGPGLLPGDPQASATPLQVAILPVAPSSPVPRAVAGDRQPALKVSPGIAGRARESSERPAQPRPPVQANVRTTNVAPAPAASRRLIAKPPASARATFGSVNEAATEPRVILPAANAGTPAMPAAIDDTNLSPPREAEPPASAPPAIAAELADRAAIRRVLDVYEQSYDRLDATAVASIWRGLDARDLTRAFGNLTSQDLTFYRCDIAPLEARATANCRGLLRYVPRVGARAPRIRSMTWVIELSRADDRWLIERVSAR